MTGHFTPSASGRLAMPAQSPRASACAFTTTGVPLSGASYQTRAGTWSAHQAEALQLCAHLPASSVRINTQRVLLRTRRDRWQLPPHCSLPPPQDLHHDWPPSTLPLAVIGLGCFPSSHPSSSCQSGTTSLLPKVDFVSMLIPKRNCNFF